MMDAERHQPARYCTHDHCRCDTAQELSALADVTGRLDLYLLAARVFEQSVRCRIVPRRGGPGYVGFHGGEQA